MSFTRVIVVVVVVALRSNNKDTHGIFFYRTRKCAHQLLTQQDNQTK